MNKKTISTSFFCIAAAFYLLSVIMLAKGYDKMVNYNSSKYTSEDNVNAYVGGDAYNYIINGNYATGFFVLATGLLISGTLFTVSGIFIRIASEQPAPIAQTKETEELPDLPEL